MKRMIKLLSVALCLSIVLSASLVGVFALSLNGITLGEKNKATADEADLIKDETVYVTANADGTVDKIIVSDWIKNNKKATTIRDVAALGDIENVKSDASFTLDSDNMRVWQADGADLYLEGTGTQPLPVDLSITYTLDGKVIDPKELAGKSGRVTIRFDYTNNTYENVTIDGKQERIYVPFLMMSGMILDGGKFDNVEVTNGKVVSDGDRTIVAGIAFPGLQHDLGLTRDEVNIPDYFEVSADTTDFALDTTITIASNALGKELDPDDLDSLDDLGDSLNQLESAMTALIDGSSQLYTGLDTLLAKSGELVSGVDQLYDGAVQLSDGAKQVDNGAGQLNDGAKKLSDGAAALSAGSVSVDIGALDLSNGLSTLSANNNALTNGSARTFTAILATARKSLVEAGLDVPELTPDNYATILNSLLDQLSEENIKAQAEQTARAKVSAAVEENRAAVTAAVTEAVRQNVQAEVTAGVRAQVTEQVLAAAGYSAADYNAAVAAGMVDAATQAQISGAIDAQMASAQVQNTISTLTEQNMQGEQAQAAIAQNTEAQIDNLIEQNMQNEEVQQGIAAALAQAKAGRESISALKEQLDSYNTFDKGLKTYTGGVGSASAGARQLQGGTSQLRSGSSELKTGTDTLSNGASTLKNGTAQLSTGADTLRDGILTMKNGMPALVDGVSQLRSGSMQLSDGLKQFNDEGISKITSLLKDNVGDLVSRVKATIRVSQNYKSYSGLADGMDGYVKFIYKTEEIN